MSIVCKSFRKELLAKEASKGVGGERQGDSNTGYVNAREMAPGV